MAKGGKAGATASAKGYTLLLDTLSEDRVDDLVALCKQAWWAEHREADAVRTMLANTDAFVAIADPDGKLVGFARVLSDRVFRAYLYDVIVDEEHRGEGLARFLLEAILDHPAVRDVEFIGLDCLEDKVAIYEKFGWQMVEPRIKFMRREKAKGG